MSKTPELRSDPDAIDAAWLQAALHDGARGPIRNVRHEAVGVGLMGRSHRFVCEHDNGAESTVVIKFPASDEAVRSMGASAYAKEIGFYRDLAPSVAGGLPRCLYADVTEDGSEFVLVMEDLAPRSPGDQLAGCSASEATLAVENLARLHGSTWGRAEIGTMAWVHGGISGGLGDIIGIVHDGFAERFADRLEPDTGPVLAQFAERIDAWLAAEPTTRALLHGDYRLDNLLFGDDDVVAVDWQTVDYRSPMRDLGYFLGNSLTPTDRRAHEDELISRYVDELSRFDIDFGVDQATAEMRHGMFQGPLVTMLGAFAASRSERSEDMFATMANRSAAQIRDHEALDVLT